MSLKNIFLSAALLSLGVLSAADLSQLVQAKRWAPAECTVKDTVYNGKPALFINMPIDHKAGEKKYPIGWPRLYTKSILPAETDWTGAKKLEIQVYTDFTGTTRRLPVSFHVYTKGDKKGLVQRFDMTNKKVTTVTMDLSKLKDRQIRQLGINIGEANYKHGENLKLTVLGYKLVK